FYIIGPRYSESLQYQRVFVVGRFCLTYFTGLYFVFSPYIKQILVYRQFVAQYSSSRSVVDRYFRNLGRCRRTVVEEIDTSFFLTACEPDKGQDENYIE